jgi:putative phosphoribosyl transferase
MAAARMVFEDRVDAGRRLAAALEHLRGAEPVVLALPRGGVVTGAEIARALGCPLDVLLVRKIGAPYQSELAVAAVVDGAEPVMVVNEEIAAALGVDAGWLDRQRRGQLAEIERRRRLYTTRRPAEVAGRTAILVDDGIATGATVRAALKALKARAPRALVLAVPVAPAATLASLRAEVDEIVCLTAPADFGAISLFYEDFAQVEDAEVVRLLEGAAGGVL